MVEIKFWDGNGSDGGVEAGGGSSSSSSSGAVGAPQPLGALGSSRTLLHDEIDDADDYNRHHRRSGSSTGGGGLARGSDPEVSPGKHHRGESGGSEEAAHDYWCGIKIDTIQFSISVAICYGASLGGMATLTGR